MRWLSYDNMCVLSLIAGLKYIGGVHRLNRFTCFMRHQE
jgi:hypothetical protein